MTTNSVQCVLTGIRKERRKRLKATTFSSIHPVDRTLISLQIPAGTFCILLWFAAERELGSKYVKTDF